MEYLYYTILDALWKINMEVWNMILFSNWQGDLQLPSYPSSHNHGSGNGPLKHSFPFILYDYGRKGNFMSFPRVDSSMLTGPNPSSEIFMDASTYLFAFDISKNSMIQYIHQLHQKKHTSCVYIYIYYIQLSIEISHTKCIDKKGISLTKPSFGVKFLVLSNSLIFPQSFFPMPRLRVASPDASRRV